MGYLLFIGGFYCTVWAILSLFFDEAWLRALYVMLWIVAACFILFVLWLMSMAV